MDKDRILTDARVHTLIRPVSSAWGSGSGRTRDGPGPRSAPSERRATGIFVPVGRRHDGCANEYILRRWGNYSQSSKLLGVRRATAQAACAGFCRLAWHTTNQHGRGKRERSRGAGGSSLTRENGTRPSPVDAESRGQRWGRSGRQTGPGAGMGATPEDRGAGSGRDAAVDQLMARESPVRVPVRQRKATGGRIKRCRAGAGSGRSSIGGWWHRMISGSSRFRLLVAQGEAGRLCRCGCGGCVVVEWLCRRGPDGGQSGRLGSTPAPPLSSR